MIGRARDLSTFWLCGAFVVLAGCEDLSGAFGSVTRTVTNRGTEFDVTYSVGTEQTEIKLSGGKTITESFDATFIEISRANGVAMKTSERKRALEIASTFCDINRLAKAPAPGRTEFDGYGWRVTNHCGRNFR